jgi:hypothetical protein
MRNYIVEIRHFTRGRQMNSEENFNIQSKMNTVKFRETDILFMRTEQTKHGIIHDNDDEKLLYFSELILRKSRTKE